MDRENDYKSLLLCPFCHRKTRVKVNADTVLIKFPLFCPKCRRETLINVEKMNMEIIRDNTSWDLN